MFFFAYFRLTFDFRSRCFSTKPPEPLLSLSFETRFSKCAAEMLYC